jgi:hypothetical protein
MRTRTVVLILVGLLAAGMAAQTLVYGASKKAGQPPAVLSQNNLRQSFQGQAGIALDLKGTGNQDLVIGAPRAGRKGATGTVLVYRATPRGFPAKPSVLLEGEGNFGWSLAALAGNIFAVGAINGSGDIPLAGTVTIYKGGAKPQKVAVLSGERAMDRFGYTLAVGDLNGDGIPDLIVGAPYHSPTPALYQKGAVYVYFGPDYVQSIKIPATSANGGLGFSAAAGDLNGDGVDDLLLQASGKVICFFGVKGAFAPSTPDVVFTSGDAGFGKSIAVLTDLNGDGFKDVAVGADQAVIGGVANSGRLYILKGGSAKGTFSADAVSLAKIDGEPNSGRFGSVLLPLGDINGDGIPDLAVSGVHADGSPWPMTGKIFLFSGSTLTSGATVASAQAIPGTARDMHLGSFMALVGKGTRLAAGGPHGGKKYRHGPALRPAMSRQDHRGMARDEKRS